MFSGNTKVESAIKIINSIEDGKYHLLLNRLAQFLSIENSSKPFTETEEAKLEGSLEITKTEVQTLVDGIIEIFHICSYYMIKPALLEDQMKALSVSPKKAEIFVQVWASSAKGIIDNLKQKIYFPQLSHVSYSVSVETSSDLSMKEKVPKAQLHLGLMSTKGQEDVNLEFNHEELYEFYQNLEQIQRQLDALR